MPICVDFDESACTHEYAYWYCLRRNRLYRRDLEQTREWWVPYLVHYFGKDEAIPQNGRLVSLDVLTDPPRRGDGTLSKEDRENIREARAGLLEFVAKWKVGPTEIWAKEPPSFILLEDLQHCDATLDLAPVGTKLHISRDLPREILLRSNYFRRAIRKAAAESAKRYQETRIERVRSCLWVYSVWEAANGPLRVAGDEVVESKVSERTKWPNDIFAEYKKRNPMKDASHPTLRKDLNLAISLIKDPTPIFQSWYKTERCSASIPASESG